MADKIRNFERRKTDELPYARRRASLNTARAVQRKNALDLSEQVEKFRSRLLAGLGENLSAEQDALALSATTMYAALLCVFRRLVKGRRVRHLGATQE